MFNVDYRSKVNKSNKSIHKIEVGISHIEKLCILFSFKKNSCAFTLAAMTIGCVGSSSTGCLAVGGAHEELMGWAGGLDPRNDPQATMTQ